MKLLFDENLSPRLVEHLSDRFPQSVHVRDVGLASATDEEVWNFAKGEGFTIASKDEDFHQRSFLYGAPPKVVWIRRGNCSTNEVTAVLRASHDVLVEFGRDDEAAFLELH